MVIEIQMLKLTPLTSDVASLAITSYKLTKLIKVTKLIFD